MKITEAIAAEHAKLLRKFDTLEELLPRFKSPAQVAAAAAVVEKLLWSHAEMETNLAFVALDHALQDKGQLSRLAQDHQEIDQRLKQVSRATTCAQARRLFRAVLRASREHFREEERSLLPAIERALKPETLIALGESYNESKSGLTIPGQRHRVANGERETH